MSDRSRPHADLRWVDVVFETRASKTKGKIVDEIAKAVGTVDGDVGETVASAVLVPQREDQSWFLSFHIDRVKSEHQLFFHLHWRRWLGKKKLPRRWEQLRAQGHTAEWLLTRAARILGKETPQLLVDCELALANWPRRQPSPFALPIMVGANVLRLIGAEFSAKEIESGLGSIRWSQNDDGLNVWLGYTTAWSPLYDPWRDERERCLHYLTQVL